MTEKNFEIVDNEEFITCRICGKQSSRIYGAHLKSHGLTSEQYLEQFPGAPLMAKKDAKNTSKNSGQHMKDEKYKTMFSEKFKGENNPNHKSKTTEQERKERSPFSKEFYKTKYVDKTPEELDKMLHEFAVNAAKDRINNTNIEFYLNLGYEQEEAEKMLSERQTTFTLEKCILKYGEEEGTKVYNNRQIQWQKSLLENGNLKCGYSKISQDLFNDIMKHITDEERIEKIYYATKEKEYFLSVKDEGFFQYDFVDLTNKKIIEYNGDQYHANPIMYEAHENPHPFRKHLTAQDIWDRDAKKLAVAKSKGFDVLVIWDTEYQARKDKWLKICLEFLGIE